MVSGRGGAAAQEQSDVHDDDGKAEDRLDLDRVAVWVDLPRQVVVDEPVVVRLLSTGTAQGLLPHVVNGQSNPIVMLVSPTTTAAMWNGITFRHRQARKPPRGMKAR